MIHQGKELVPRFLAVAEGAQHGAGHGAGVLLFHAAHHHAEMTGFADYAHAHRVDNLLDGLCYLLRQTLLNLQAPRKDVDDARNLAKADHLGFGKVGDVHFAEERQHMVLAHAEELDVAHNHHLVVLHVEESAVDYLLYVHAVAAG